MTKKLGPTAFTNKLILFLTHKSVVPPSLFKSSEVSVKCKRAENKTLRKYDKDLQVAIVQSQTTA